VSFEDNFYLEFLMKKRERDGNKMAFQFAPALISLSFGIPLTGPKAQDLATKAKSAFVGSLRQPADHLCLGGRCSP
jgi:hypothetical protein